MGLFSSGGADTDAMIAQIEAATQAAERDYSPYVGGGQSAQQQMMAQLGLGGPASAFDVSQLPGYQQSLSQGLSAVNQAGAGSGMLMSGQRLQDLQTKGQDVFGDYYRNYMGDLTGMSGRGLSAVGGLSNLRMGGAQNIAGLMQQDAAAGAGMMGDLLGAGAGIGGAVFGGPIGGMLGKKLGGMMGGGDQGGGGGFDAAGFGDLGSFF